MVRLENVKKYYDQFELDLTLAVRPGYVTGLIGKNGAGKSTAFKAILGLIKTDGGTVEVFQKPVSSIGLKEKENIGAVLADSGFSAYLSIQDLVPVLKGMYQNFHREDFLRRCKELGLPFNKKIKEFSTGMKRKLQVLAAISHEAKLLVLDEPTAGLDVVARDELLDMLREYMETEDRAILISSHISSDIESFCDDIYMIDDGRILLHEDTDVLLSSYAILKLTKEQYQALCKKYLICCKKEDYGYRCLTDKRQFYQENYPDVIAEKGSVDELIMMMVRGEKQ